MFFRPEFNIQNYLLLVFIALTATGCRQQADSDRPVLTWYVYNEPSGAFAEAALNCTEAAKGRYSIALKRLPTDADQQREQLVRRLAANDPAIDIIGMDVIWTAEFAEAGWLLPWPIEHLERAMAGRLPSALASANYRNRLWALPFTANAQLLWYRKDRIDTPPATWDDLIHHAEAFGITGALQIQGKRYEGLTVLFVSLLASAGGSVLDETGTRVSLAPGPTRSALDLMKRLATSPSIDDAVDTADEDRARLAFESGLPTFMSNYSFVWPSARQNAPEVAGNMAFARWPRVSADLPSRVALGGLNLAVPAFSRYPKHAFEAVECLASSSSQLRAAKVGGLPPTLIDLYDDPAVRQHFPFAATLRATLQDAVLRPPSPFYNDISLAISRTLHPIRAIDPINDAERLRHAVQRALDSEGLL